MVSVPVPDAQSGGPFESALSLLRRRAEARPLSTGSPELDDLIGGVEPGAFYLFYGAEDEGAPDRLLHRLLVEAVKPGPGGPRKAIYMVCGNYRRSRTNLDPGLLLALLEAETLSVAEAFSRIHVVCAFSERQQVEAARMVEDAAGRMDGVSLIAVQQISKLFSGPPLIRHGGFTEFTRIISRLKGLCSEGGIALAATGRPSGRGRPVPSPEGGNFLRHAANAIVYLRAPRDGVVSARLVKHPDRARMGRMVEFGGETGPGLGRATGELARRRMRGLAVQLEERFRSTLKDAAGRRAFDRLRATWADVPCAATCLKPLSAMDLLLLTAVVDNRRGIEELKVLSREARRMLPGDPEGVADEG